MGHFRRIYYVWLKTRLAWVKIASHLSNAGRDDQKAPSLWPTWLHGALAQVLNGREKGQAWMSEDAPMQSVAIGSMVSSRPVWGMGLRST